MNSSVYVHVPFCARRCDYCSFYSTVSGNELKTAYTHAVMAEAACRASEAQGRTVRSIYFGGGTPSQLPVNDIARILESIFMNFSVHQDAEITLEANPDDVSPAFATALRSVGINRVSMGVQSFHDEVLASINRRHNASEAVSAVENLYNAGIENISIDLIYGLPQQNMAIFEADIDKAITLPIRHLSSYALSIEEGTPLFLRKQQGKIREASEETFVKMYSMLCDKLDAAGFLHYEISNFCRPGYESYHNGGYWNGRQYVGLGPGAHSYDGVRTRRSNDCNLQFYNRFWTSSRQTDNGKPYEIEELNTMELYDEKIMTRLRCREGLALEELTYEEQRYLLRTAQPYIQSGDLQNDGKRIRLTRKGIFISDAIMAELMWDSNLIL